MKKRFVKSIITLLLVLSVVVGCTITNGGAFAAEDEYYLHEHKSVDGICTDCGLPEQVTCVVYSDYVVIADFIKSNSDYENIIIDLVIPETIEGRPVTSIGSEAFWNVVSLRSVMFPQNLKTVEMEAFRLCENLERVVISSGVEVIEEVVFMGCTNLKSITVDEKNKNYCSDEDGVLYNKNKTVLMQYPCGRVNSYYEASSSVETVAFGSFAECNNLEYVVFSDNVKHLGNCVFSGCENLVGVYLPESIESFGLDVFKWVGEENFSHVMYEGTEEEFNSIDNIEEQLPQSAVIHYGVTDDDFFLKDAVEANCQSKGYTGDWYCNECQVVCKTGVETEKTGHSYEVSQSDEKVMLNCQECGDVCEVTSSGAAVIEGKLSSGMSADVKIVFKNKNDNGNSYTVNINDSDVYSIYGIENGDYLVQASKPNHVTRNYNVSVGTDNVNLDLKLNLIGDINGDNKITVQDYTQVLKHVKKVSNLEGYIYDCADVNGDGNISVVDYTRLLKHVKKIDMLW